jgi:hypothetical protein
MTDKLKQTIKEEMEKLPKETQEAINASSWERVAEEIGRKYLLNEDEINNLQVETLLILIGLEDPEFFATNVENEIGTSKNEAEKITEDVIQKIFTPINDVLVENIKKSKEVKDPKWDQSLNFILSGGDYHSFMAPTGDTTTKKQIN